LTRHTPAVKFRSYHARSSGDVISTRAGKPRHPREVHQADPHPVDSSRREFLLRCCQGASIAAFPPALRSFAFGSPPFFSPPAPFSESEFHLHPRYRQQRPLDATLLKTQSDLDAFVTEKYHDQTAAILAKWSESLLQSPQDVKAIAAALAPDFSGSSLRSLESRPLRSGPIEIHRNKFSSTATLASDAFLRELRSSLAGFSNILTAEFQVTSIHAGPAAAGQLHQRLQTRVRYELVGTGENFHREQRVGSWDLEWIPAALSSDQFLLSSWQSLEETRSRSIAPVFADITASALGSSPSYAAQLLHGSDYWRTLLDGACGIDLYGHNGVSIADIDGDSFDDLYICQPAGLPNRLYRNRGDGRFDDITDSSGLGLLENTACAIFADFQNTGCQDAVIVRANGPLLFVNDGNGKFRIQPGAFQFATPPQGTFTGAAAADYDRDGWLDIYFCLYSYYQGADQYKYPLPYHDAENGPPNFLMHNNRDGTFRDVTAASGLNQSNTRYSFCCGWSDYNRDGWPDLYVVNDFGRKNLYRNNGDGTFTDVASEAGVEDIGAGMSVSWLDYDNDGAQDLYVANMWTAAGERISSQEIFKEDSPQAVRALYQKHAMGNSLFRNDSVGSAAAFHNQTDAAAVGMGRWSWSSDAFDFDHDGFPDLYIANGMVSGPTRDDLNSFFWRQVVAKSPDHAKPAPDYEQGWNAINELIRADGTWSGYERNVFYANNRDGTFSDVSGVVDLDFVEDGRSFALADFDHDGRQEIFLKNRNAPQLRLLKNVMPNLPPSIAFRLRGTKSNRDAIGASITIETNAGRQTRMLQAGSGFLSQHSKELFFGLGDATGPVRASIRWPSGLVQEFHDLAPNHRIWIEEGSGSIRAQSFNLKTQASTHLPTPAPEPVETLPSTVETWLLAPISAPDFSLPDLNGKIRSLADFGGKPVLLNFWVSSSSTCRANLKVLNRSHSRWAPQGLQLLTINVDEAAGAERFAELIRNEHFSFPILRGSDEVAAVYNILFRYLFDRHRDLTLPTSLVIDGKQQVVKIYQGQLPEHFEQDVQRIPQTDAQRLVLALPFPGAAETFTFGRNYLSYGSIYFQRGYFAQAAAAFQSALRDDPSSAEACYGLGSAYLNLQKTAEARDSFERATKLRASYPDTLANAWNNLGLLATRDHNLDEAIRCFQEAVRQSSANLIALNNLGNAYRAKKNWEAARRTFERALEVNQSDPEANYGLAMVFAQADDTAHAYEYLHRALESKPDYPEALNNLGILYLRSERRDQAVAEFEECIRVAPAFDQSYLNLARVYVVEGASNKARAVLLDLLMQHPDHAQAKNMLAQLPQ
jgi:tetratricopeptide (TPR) repeat protein